MFGDGSKKLDEVLKQFAALGGWIIVEPRTRDALLVLENKRFQEELADGNSSRRVDQSLFSIGTKSNYKSIS